MSVAPVATQIRTLEEEMLDTYDFDPRVGHYVSLSQVVKWTDQLAALLVVGNIDEEGFSSRWVAFDPDDLDAGYQELDATYLAASRRGEF